MKEPEVREVVTWELAQKYFIDPTFGGALVPGQRNVFTTTADFTGIAFLNEARRLSPLISRLRFQATNRTEAEWDIDYDFKNSRINASTAFVNYRFGPYTIGGGDAFLQAPSATVSSTIPTSFQSVPYPVWLRIPEPSRVQRSHQSGIRRQSGLSAVFRGATGLQLGLLRPQCRVPALCPGLGSEREPVPLQFRPGKYRFIRKSEASGKAVLTAFCSDTNPGPGGPLIVARQFTGG